MIHKSRFIRDCINRAKGKSFDVKYQCYVNLYSENQLANCMYSIVVMQARSQTFFGGGQIGQIWGPFMITRGLSCDRVEFGHFGGGGQMTPLTPPGYGPVMYLFYVNVVTVFCNVVMCIFHANYLY